MDNAKKFYESEDLKKVMQDAGVIGKPDVWFLDKIEDFKLWLHSEEYNFRNYDVLSPVICRILR